MEMLCLLKRLGTGDCQLIFIQIATIGYIGAQCSIRAFADHHVLLALF